MTIAVRPDRLGWCRYCQQRIALKGRGWRLATPESTTSFACPSAPSEYHGLDRTRPFDPLPNAKEIG